MPDKNKIRIITSWCFYDWAASSFSIIVSTFIFATYFTSRIASNEITGTYQWANATALAGIIVAIGAPLFGAIADYGGYIKRWLFIFTAGCIIGTSLLWFAYPAVTFVRFTLMCIVIATVCLEIGLVFYNAFLPRIAPKEYLGRISGWGWSAGYFGGIVALSIVLFLFISMPHTWLDTTNAAQVRICGPFTAIWFAVFSLPLFLFVPDTSPQHPLHQAITRGIHELLQTLKNLPRQKNLFLFLIAHMIYADGLNTLFAFGGIYAAGTFKMDLSAVVLFGLSMNIAAGIGALIFAWIDDYLGSKKTILISLGCLMSFGIPLLIVREQKWFWVSALMLSLFVGPVQSGSRSLMAHLSPIERSTEMFGLYAVSGRITTFIGPWMLGLSTLYFHTQRAGMAIVLLFFLVGGILLSFVQHKN